ncbi:MAG: CPBP family intramembrane glutamic endopeptidase [Candidatus Micrarchaeia archaeon]
MAKRNKQASGKQSISPLSKYAFPAFWALASLAVCSLLAFAFSDPSWYTGGLFFLAAALWLFVSRLGKEKMGFCLGSLQDYAIAVAYPLCILAGVVAVMVLTGEDLNPILSVDQAYSFAGMFVIFIVLNFFTTGLFFRGWLFGFMEGKKIGAKEVVIFTSFAYCMWHIPLFFIDPDYMVSANMMPVFLAGVLLDGMVWGLIRLKSGAIAPGAVGHALWDAVTFGIFGFGIHPMLISIPQIEVFGLQRGFVSVALRLVFVAALWYWLFKRK